MQTQRICPVCGMAYAKSALGSKSYPSADSFGRKPMFQSIDICAGCGTGTAWPRYTDLELDSIYSQGDYWKSRDVTVFTPRNYPSAYANARARWLFFRANVVAGKAVSVLDIGAGQGMFGLAAAVDSAVKLKEYHAVESDVFCCRSLEKTWRQVRPDIDFTIIPDLKHVPRKYDLVVLSHILEHINDPAGLLKGLSAVLSPGGHVLVDVPFWDHLYKADVYPHVSFFGLKSLETLLQGSGYRAVSISGFGRSRSEAIGMQSGRNSSKLAEKLIYHTRHLCPAAVPVGFYDRLWQPSRTNSEGIWLRALATQGR